MQGRVIGFDRLTGSAKIMGCDGLAYTATSADVVGDETHLWTGAGVDFIARRDRARKVVVLAHQSWLDFASATAARLAGWRIH